MSRPAGETRRVTISAASLGLFQTLSLVLPLLTLPLLGRSLGVELFGQIMLAQFIVFFGVVFIDSGFNVESQRRVAVATDEHDKLQALLDNLVARTLIAGGVTMVVLAVGALMPGLPMWMVWVSLLHLAGTLIFPQWWFAARDEGFRMGVVSIVGRITSTLLVLSLVRSPADACVALLAASSATLISGLMVWPKLLRRFRSHDRDFNWQGYKGFIRAVRPVIFSGFVASSAQSIPTVVLGWMSGPQHVGLFAAADRLTRAAAHLSSVMGLPILNVAARLHANSAQDLHQFSRRLMLVTAGLCVGGAAVLIMLSKPVIHLLYGDRFLESVFVLQLLTVWLGLNVLRTIWLTLEWKARGLLNQLAQLQWQEGFSVIAVSAMGAWLNGATGVAGGLVLSELGLLIRLLAMHRTPDLAELRASR